MLVKVTNRSSGTVGYIVPELNNLTRRFAAGESKNIDADELRKLSWTPGGRSLVTNYLVIDNAELVKELLGEIEPEYHYTAEDVKTLLLHGTDDQLRDALDFGPDGVKSLIKDIAVDIRLDSMSKRDIIFESTGFNVNNAIIINAESEKVAEAPKERRAAAITAEPQAQEEKPSAAAPVRRAPQYKVIK